MESKLKDTSIGETVATKGAIDNVECHLFVMRCKDDAMKLMKTCDSLTVRDDANDSARCVVNASNPNLRRRVAFKCVECCENYYYGRHEADHHDHSRLLVP